MSVPFEMRIWLVVANRLEQSWSTVLPGYGMLMYRSVNGLRWNECSLKESHFMCIVAGAYLWHDGASFQVDAWGCRCSDA